MEDEGVEHFRDEDGDVSTKPIPVESNLDFEKNQNADSPEDHYPSTRTPPTLATMNQFRAKKIAKIVLFCVPVFVILYLILREGSETVSDLGFSGEYSDPNHTNCIRHIEVKADGIHAYVFGTDGDPGCPEDGNGVAWRLDGIVEGADNTIVVDFSPKGGPKSLEGKRTETGILWEDQNFWTEKRASTGSPVWAPTRSPVHPEPSPSFQTFSPTESFIPTFHFTTTHRPTNQLTRVQTDGPSETWPPTFKVTSE